MTPSLWDVIALTDDEAGHAIMRRALALKDSGGTR